MKPLKIYFRVSHVGNGKFLKTKHNVNNLIVDIISRNTGKPAAELREIIIREFQTDPSAQQALGTNSRFFIAQVIDIEVLVTYLPDELKPEDQFYIQWRYVQKSEAYRLVQYLDENKVVVYSEKTKVLHTVKLDKDIVVVADENL